MTRSVTGRCGKALARAVSACLNCSLQFDCGSSPSGLQWADWLLQIQGFAKASSRRHCARNFNRPARDDPAGVPIPRQIICCDKKHTPRLPLFDLSSHSYAGSQASEHGRRCYPLSLPLANSRLLRPSSLLASPVAPSFKTNPLQTHRRTQMIRYPTSVLSSHSSRKPCASSTRPCYGLRARPRSCSCLRASWRARQSISRLSG
jgi:hypothetical protein